MLLVPAAAQEGAGIENPYQSTPTTLYMHLDGIQDFPINTQPPDDRYQKGNPYGLTTNSFSCAGRIDGASIATNSYHTYYGYSSPGYVQYDFEEDGGPRYHKERGLSFDIDLDSNAPVTVDWYLETQASSAENAANDVPILVPDVVVRATLRDGDEVGVGDAPFNEGAIIAQGETDPAKMSPVLVADHPQVTHSEVNGKQVYKFEVPLDYQNARISGEESYNIRVDVFMDNPYCDNPQYPDDQYVMPNNVRPHTSPGHRPSIHLAVMNPLVVDYLHPQFIGDELVIHTSVNSPWGNYDVDEAEGGVTLTIDGPTPAMSLYRAAFVQPHDPHGHHQEAVAITYAWPYKADNAQDGVYTVAFTARNDQGTAEATGTARFQIGEGDLPPCDPDVPITKQTSCAYVPTVDTPGESVPAAPLGLVLLGVLALLRRR